MFANLKNKLIEEVKASPSKFQQLASAAQAAVSSSTSMTQSALDTATNTTTTENFFSITEEDTPQNSPYKPRLSGATSPSGRSSTPTQYLNSGVNTGSIPRTKRLSNSSLASDTSFRLTAQESAHHLQSDLDISASEMEDTNSSVKLETITKEQLYNAYKASEDRYNKYRCRYTDLAQKYKDLERDSDKARCVLVETQEKAIRRINELREQCALEQQAKAHLEESLRMEMDDMQCKMQAYQTKLQLLGENPVQIAEVLSSGTPSDTNASKDIPLIELDVVEPFDCREIEKKCSIEQSLSKHDSKENNDESHLKLQQHLKEYEIKFNSVNKKYEESLATIELLRKEKEDEEEHRSTELMVLQNTVKTLQADLQKATEEYIRECSIKNEIEEKMTTNDRLLTELKEKYRLQTEALSAAEKSLTDWQKESKMKMEVLQQQNTLLSDDNERYKCNETSLAEINNELNQTRKENDILKSSLLEIEQKLKEVEEKVKSQKDSTDDDREKSRLYYEECIRELENKLQNYTELLEEIRSEKECEQRKIQQLQADLEVANKDEDGTILKMNNDLKSMQIKLTQSEEELMSRTAQLESSQNQNEMNKTFIEKQMDQMVKLQEELQTARITFQEQKDQDEREKNSLKEQLSIILNEIADMQQQMHIIQQSHDVLEQEKRALEDKIEKVQRDLNDENNWQEKLQASEIKLAKLEKKLQSVESENAQLAEQNCLLVENSTRLEKLIDDREKQQNEALEKITISEIEAKLDIAEATIQKLNNKITQVLDENSCIKNTQEIMAQDNRSLQDKIDTLEKENFIALENKQCLELELQQLKTDAGLAHETKLREMQSALENSEVQFEIEQRIRREMQNELRILQERHLQMESENSLLKNELYKLQETLSQKEGEYNAILEEKQKTIEELLQEVNILNEKFFNTAQNLKQANEELARLRLDNGTLDKNMTQTINKLEEREKELKSTQKDFEIIQHELRTATKNLEAKEVETKSMQEMEKENYQRFKEQLQEKQKRIDDLENEFKRYKNYDKEMNSLREKLQKAIDERDLKNEELLLVREENSRLNEDLSVTEENLQQKLEFIVKLQNEQKEYENNRNDELFQLKNKIAELNDELIANQNEIKGLQRNEHELRGTLKKQLLESQEKVSACEREQELELVELKETNLKPEVQCLMDKVAAEVKEKEQLTLELSKLKAELAERTTILTTPRPIDSEDNTNDSGKLTHANSEHLRELNAVLQKELEDLKHKSKSEILNLQQEINELQIRIKQESENNDIDYSNEIKLRNIMQEVQDVSNRNLFLEQKCENYLILEQSNERLKLQNAKLTRQLDETLVSMHYSEGITANTEFEYLKNIMFQYLTGATTTNNETLVKVISAVLKFSPQQTQVALEKEHQRRSLLSKLL